MTSRHKFNQDTSNSDIAALITDNIRLGGIQYCLVGKLQLYDRQLKNHPEEQIIQLMASIRTFGFVSPVLIDEHDVVIDGEALVLAARRLGLREIPKIRIDHLDPNQVRLLRLTLKKLATKSSWNDPELAIELGELLVLDLDISLDVTGFSFVEIDNLVAPPKGPADLDATCLPRFATSLTASRRTGPACSAAWEPRTAVPPCRRAGTCGWCCATIRCAVRSLGSASSAENASAGLRSINPC